MAGIYIHIPFCKQACHYCNFHFSTSLQYKKDFVAALIKEIDLRKDYLGGDPVNTVYIGGGTPSLLSRNELVKISEKLYKCFSIDKNSEITLEANPDDLTHQKIQELKNSPVNRLSIGVQSFFDDDLQLMNRAHNSDNALRSISEANDAGFSNITIDLMYALPTLTDEKWIKNLETAFSLPVQHLSCYNLTVEEQTALSKFIQQGKIPQVDENRSVRQFELLQKRAEENGFEQYEISNFAKDGAYSLHNSNYWKGEHYVGFGPSAHSFNGSSRQWNIANNQLYIRSIINGKLNFEKENLEPSTQYNEYVMTSLRTKWGADIYQIENRFGRVFTDYFKSGINVFLKSEDVLQHHSVYTLTPKGKLIADHIASQLFVVKEKNTFSK